MLFVLRQTMLHPSLLPLPLSLYPPWLRLKHLTSKGQRHIWHQNTFVLVNNIEALNHREELLDVLEQHLSVLLPVHAVLSIWHAPHASIPCVSQLRHSAVVGPRGSLGTLQIKLPRSSHIYKALLSIYGKKKKCEWSAENA